MEVVVSGRVQGVSFRAWTQEQARRLGLRGWVRNQPDGTVCALFAGEESALDAMQQALWQGPAAARVDDVRVTPIEVPELSDFAIRG